MVGPGVEEERLMSSFIVSTILSSGILWTAADVAYADMPNHEQTN